MLFLALDIEKCKTKAGLIATFKQRVGMRAEKGTICIVHIAEKRIQKL